MSRKRGRGRDLPYGLQTRKRSNQIKVCDEKRRQIDSVERCIPLVRSAVEKESSACSGTNPCRLRVRDSKPVPRKHTRARPEAPRSDWWSQNCDLIIDTRLPEAKLVQMARTKILLFTVSTVEDAYAETSRFYLKEITLLSFAHMYCLRTVYARSAYLSLFPLPWNAENFGASSFFSFVSDSD